jgi:hypothetical protein
VAGAAQHVGFTAAVENASAAVKTQATKVNAALADATGAIDRALAAAQKLREAEPASDAAPTVRELQASIDGIASALQQSDQEMRVMMKAEGL